VIESDKRIKFIAEYISAYEEKIKLLNSNGLFDAAKLFELFAIEVGSLYFGQKLSNLNVETFTYPCVDLVSEDKKTYIQVSTVKNIHSKIKSTLESIRDSERPEIKAITNVKFFLLNNDSVNKVKNHIGKAQIGNVPFNKVFDLITTSHILKKAETDLDFQIALYQLMKKETDSIRDNSSKLKDAIENSKSIGLGNIDCRLNDEYEIDRAELIAKIIKDNPKNTSIQGGAGSGKSVLCKKLVEGESCFVYARAERFLEETDINNIWGFNVRETLEYLKDKPIMFFVDSLEFIADSPTKLDLLSILYECTKNYPSARIITSCRTSDKKAFIKIEGNYSIHSYEVSELTVSEQLAIATKYPIIKKMLDINSYAELLKSPLYINLIVTKITNIDNIYDENQLREYIWHNVICLNDKNIREVIESIVFTRAREFLVGVLSANYDTKTISKLISENIIVRNGNTVRLKYDVFEDICFEQYLDNEFDKSKGKYDSFFKRIEAFGRCIYRRYQIWISNKLLAKCNRDKFLYELIFSKKMPLFWRNQTEIGLVKSRFCTEFFGENGQAIIKNGLLGEFVKMTNLYAFEMQNDAFIGIFPLLQLRPSGLGRQGLIHLIFENKIHEGDSISIFDFKKLCADYARTQPKDKKTAEEACAILIHIIERYISESEKKDFYNLKETINSLLKSLYQMTEYAKDWIITFWDRIASFYKKGTHSQRILADDIIKDALKFEHIQLATYMPIELCGLAEMYWTYSPKDKHGDDDFGFYQRDKNERSYQYGLSEKAEHYSFGSTRNTATDSNFFHILFQKNFWDGLNWAIEFVNKAVLNLSAKIAKGLPTYEINFLEDNLKREYLGFHEMWLVTTQEHSMPLVLSDLIYCLKEKLRYVIKNDAVKNKETVKFANNVKKTIYEKSNNTALLTIIADIGMEFIQKLPGFALDLATNIYIILDDLSRLALIVKNPVKEMLEKQIWMTVCMPFPMLHRYKKEDIEEYDLRSYVVDSQLYFGDKLRIKCQNILDYLYSIIPNDKENATEYLQIQNMDLLRTAQAVKVDEKTIALIPTITGEAKKVANKGKKQIQPENDLALLLKECTEKMAENKFELVDCLKTIDLIMDAAKKTVIQTMHENLIIAFIAIALRNGKLDVPTREKFCRFWIEGIRKYFSNGSFNYEYNISCVLFAQIETDIGDETKRQIKNLMLDLVQHQGQNGILLDIARLTRQYLSTNESFAQAIFNTIVKLAEDEMNHQKINADYL
jgi:hypothetical protein